MPSQISPPIEYTDGDPINADAFNGHVKNATLQNGSITEQTSIDNSAVPSVDRLDSLTIYDDSEITTNRLRKIKVENLFGTGAPIATDSITTSVINAKVHEDIIATPGVGEVVFNKAFYTPDGLNVTVTSTGHGLETGMLVSIGWASYGDFTGRFQITSTSGDTFTFYKAPVTPYANASGSGTLNYYRDATLSVIGSITVNDDAKIAGRLDVAGNSEISGALNVGSLKIAGKTPLTAEDSFLGINVKTVTLPVGTAFGTVDYATQAFNVPPGETWTFIWTAITDQYNSTGNTRPSVGYTWEIYVGNLTGSKVDSVGAGNQGYGGTSSISRSIVVRNEGTTGNNHTIQSPTVGMTYAGTMNLTWTAKPPVGWSKWEKGHINIILIKQKTASINYGHPQVL